MAYLTPKTLAELGFAALGSNVLISDKASIYGAGRIKIGSHVRIDDFCVLSAGEGGIEIGNFVHIAVGALLIGAGSIVLEDFCGLSSKVSIYSSTDDYSGATLTNPCIPAEFTNVQSADVRLKRHVIVGSGSVLLPGIVLEEGVAIGALSLVHKSCPEFSIYSGNPARKIADRKRDLLQVETQFLDHLARKGDAPLSPC